MSTTLFLSIYLLLSLIWFLGMLFRVRLFGSPSDYEHLAAGFNHGRTMSSGKYISAIALVCLLCGLLWPIMLFLRVKDVWNGGW